MDQRLIHESDRIYVTLDNYQFHVIASISKCKPKFNLHDQTRCTHKNKASVHGQTGSAAMIITDSPQNRVINGLSIVCGALASVTVPMTGITTMAITNWIVVNVPKLIATPTMPLRQTINEPG